jgi:hypothetical protein
MIPLQMFSEGTLQVKKFQIEGSLLGQDEDQDVNLWLEIPNKLETIGQLSDYFKQIFRMQSPVKMYFDAYLLSESLEIQIIDTSDKPIV